MPHTHTHTLIRISKHPLARVGPSRLPVPSFGLLVLFSKSYSLRHVNLQALHQPPIHDFYLVSAFQIEFQ